MPCFGVLGPLQVLVGGREVRLPPKSRAVLAALLLRAGQIASVAELIESVWGAEPPASAQTKLQGHVSGIRNILRAEPDAAGRVALTWRPAGYTLTVGPAELDLLAFDEIVRTAHRERGLGQQEAAAGHLRDALALWRGQVLPDVSLYGDAQLAAEQLAQRRLVVLDERIEADLALGRHAELVPELEALAAAHPLRERLHGQLMTALYRSGRQVEAIATYRRARHRLITDFGVEPGPDLQRVLQAVLRGEPPGTAPGESWPGGWHQQTLPRQLPPDTPGFVGRGAELRRIGDLLASSRRAVDGPAVAMITGPGGIGKTALAVHAAHAAADHFRDGQLFARLRRADNQPVPTADVLAAMLRSTGVTGAGIPDSVEERSGLLRSRMAGRRVLMVLDDACSAAQISALLPAEPGCAVIITSRLRLDSIDSAPPVKLDVLAPEQALELLGQFAGPERVAGEPGQAADIIGYCGHLPLAIRIAGARLADRPHWTLSWLASRLRNERSRLDVLRASELDVRGCLALSYRVLSASARRMIRMLGLLEIPDLTASIGAAAAAVAEAEAAQLMEELVDAQLLHTSGMDDRGDPWYQFHELTRVFAADLAGAEEEPEQRLAAIVRVGTALLAQSRAAEPGLPGGARGVGWSLPAAGQASPGDAPAVAPCAWFAAESANLGAMIGQLCRCGQVRLAGDLAASTSSYYEIATQFDAAERINREVANAAEAAGDDFVHAHALRRLGAIAVDRGDAARGSRLLEQALGVLDGLAVPDRRGQAYAWRELGVARDGQGRPEDAADLLCRALAVFEELGDVQGTGITLYSQGAVAYRRRDYVVAAALLHRSRALLRTAGQRQYEAAALRLEGRVSRQAGDLAAAHRYLDLAEELFGEIGDDHGRALCWLSRGSVLAGERRGAEAAQWYRRAAAVFAAKADRFGWGRAQLGLGELALAEGNASAAAGLFRDSLEQFTAYGVTLWEDRALRRLQSALASAGEAQPAKLAT
jgi:DNA-binding SARP family transcriptional activator